MTTRRGVLSSTAAWTGAPLAALLKECGGIVGPARAVPG